MDIRLRGSGNGSGSGSWNLGLWTRGEADFSRNLYSVELLSSGLLSESLSFAQGVELGLHKVNLLILVVGLVGSDVELEGVLVGTFEEVGRDWLVLGPLGIPLSPGNIVIEPFAHVATRDVSRNEATIGKGQLPSFVTHDLLLLNVLGRDGTFAKVVVGSTTEDAAGGGEGALSARRVPRGGGFCATPPGVVYEPSDRWNCCGA